MIHPTAVATHPASLYLRDEALKLLHGGGAILETAREVSSLMREAGIPGVVIGGIAVLLHGYVRTTVDIDIFIEDRPERLADLLTSHGFTHDPARREFVRDGLPIHLVLADQVGHAPRRMVEIDGVTTISLADLVEMKLRSGTSNLLRAIDLADVIGLIRRHRLSGSFTPRLSKDVRNEFSKLARAIEREG